MPAITRWSRRTECSGRAPCAASCSRRSSGSSGARSMLREPVELPGAQQHDQLAAAAVEADARDAALLHVDAPAGEVVDDLREVGLVADDEDALVRMQQLERVLRAEALAQ